MEGIEKEFMEFKTNMLEYISGLKVWQDQTTEYRKLLCGKIDHILDKLANLPCRERGGWYQSMGKQIGFMWVALTAMVIPMVLLLVRVFLEK